MNNTEELNTESSPYLASDIEKIVIETDEENPKKIASITDILNPEEGYVVRVKFKEKGAIDHG